MKYVKKCLNLNFLFCYLSYFKPFSVLQQNKADNKAKNFEKRSATEANQD